MQIIATHKNTDFDALASVVAATVLFPEALPVLPKTVNPNVKAFLSIHKDVFETYAVEEIELGAVRELVVVDTNNWHRLDGLRPLETQRGLRVRLFDHHEGAGNIAAEKRCQEAVGATITLLIRQLKEARKLITPIQATLFLAGLYEDTGNLSFPSSTAEDAYAAGYLLERRADLNMINTFLRPAYGEKQKEVLFDLLQQAERRKVNGYRIGVGKLTLKGHVESLALVVHMFRDILNVDAAFGIFENPERGKCIVIGRSHVESLDMGALMRRLGGGGHPAAGSAMVADLSGEQVEALLVDGLSGGQTSQTQVSDLMSYPVVSVEADTPMAQVAALLREKGCTGVPVLDQGRLVGIVSRRDFRKLKKESQLRAPAKAFMSARVITIEPGKSPDQAAALMVKHDIGRLPVVADGRILGIVTRSDAMRYFYDLLPD